MNSFCTPNDSGIMSGSDSRSIQSAVNHAKSLGYNKVVIPRYNARTGGMRWDIGEVILLPSDMTVILDNCHMCMADGVFCNMFRNSNAYTEVGNTLDGTQKNIAIIGIGQSTLDGGEPNGLDEFSSSKDGYPHIYENLTIYLHNVVNFRVENITILNQRWWSMAFMFARHGHIADIDFVLDRHDIDSKTRWRNQDGIDLRVGCNDIIIENIHGECGDDVIALTALAGPKGEIAQRVEGLDRDIHDVIIQNVRAYPNMCAIIRLLNHFGQKIYNVTMRDIYDISRRHETSKPQMAIRIGDDGYFRDITERAKPGELYNIVIENLHTRALAAVITAVSVKNMVCRDIFVENDGGYVWSCGVFHGSNVFIYHKSRDEEMEATTYYAGKDFGPTSAENVTFENVYYTADGAKSPALFGFNNCELKNISVRYVSNDSELPLIKFFNMAETEIDVK